MRAVILDKPGGNDALELRDVPVPRLTEGQALIRVESGGLNWADIQVRQGIYPHIKDYPFAAGFEIAGTINALGAGVRGYSVGERVAAIVFGGGFADFAAADASYLMRLPPSVSFDVGAAFPIQALTAYHMLNTLSHIGSGDTVLVHAIGGGVGLFVTQMAAYAGARVIGTVGTRGKEVLALEYGASEVVNRADGDFAKAVLAFTDGRGVDLAIDSLGGATLDKTFDVVRILGHVINIGEAEANPYPNLRDRLIGRSLTFTRFHAGHLDPNSDMWRRGVDYVLQAIADGWLHVPIVERFPLEQVRRMYERLESRSVSGKLVLSIGA